MMGQVCTMVLYGWVLASISFMGCAEKPKAPPQPSASQVKSDSDRFFDKMKQDEREQGKGMAPAH